MSAHARLSPSGAETWMTCPGSVAAQDGLPDDENEYSAEGTVAHKIFELCLTLGIEADAFVGQVRQQGKFLIPVVQEMADFLQPIIDEIDAVEGEKFFENSVDLGKWLPKQFGTLDVGILTDTHVEIRDLKYGMGIVSAYRNKQLMLYALGFCAWLNSKGYVLKGRRIKLIIHQPRVATGGDSWELSLDELMAFGKEARAAGEATYAADAPRVASEKGCQWCKAKDTCKVLAAHNLKTLSADFENLDALDLPDPDKITVEQRSAILRQQPMIEKWLSAMYIAALGDATAGRAVPGFKLAYGRAPHRAWKDERAAQKWLERKQLPIYQDPKLITPAEAERALKSRFPARKKADAEVRKQVMEDFAGQWSQGDPKPTLVREESASAAITPWTEEFEDLDAN